MESSIGSVRKGKGMDTKPRRAIVGVMGSGQPGDHDHLAYELGKLLAQEGFIVLTGGGEGIMKAASRGASEAGGLVVGILPSAGWDDRKYASQYPNEYVDVPIFTGMGDARNAINVKTSDVVIALPGGAGTLSEIGLALKSKKGVIVVGWPDFALPKSCVGPWLHQVDSPQAAVDKVKELLAEA